MQLRHAQFEKLEEDLALAQERIDRLEAALAQVAPNAAGKPAAGPAEAPPTIK